MKIWICAITKMEELYIREWIEWYKQLGIDHIVIGDNNDSDYDKPLQPIIQDYIDEGFVEIINLNNQRKIQVEFYDKVYQERKNEFDWIGFIDIDEFVELPAYNNDIHLFLSDNKFKDTDSIILPWLNYGDNEQLYYEDKPVKKRFTKFTNQFYACDKSIKFAGIKFFIKSFNNIYAIESIHYPLNIRIETTNGTKYGGIKCCDSMGNFDYIPFNPSIHENRYWVTDIIINDNYYNNAYIAHYITKSTEEYIKFKCLRGVADIPLFEDKSRYDEQYYFWVNKKSKNKIKMFEEYKDTINKSVKEQLQRYKNSNGLLK